jgi:hypothetical protein
MIDGEVRICGAFERNLTFGFSKKIENNYKKNYSA